MKKAAVAFLISSLAITGFCLSSAFADTAMDPEAAVIAKNFTQIAMDEFSSIDDTQLDYTAVSSKVQEYAQNFAAALLGERLSPQAAGMIMDKAASWYGKILEGLFNGKSYNQLIQDYSKKVSSLLSQNRLALDAQIKIITMTSDNLESIRTLFRYVAGAQEY